ncbi:MAG: DUF2085 domain-containing protein [Anaerolineales bacterium]|nr:DUF2085 domain-containing protein [Anaerolineales bacterium]
MEDQHVIKSRKKLTIILGIIALLVLIIWSLYTPEGLHGKADAVGYSVCHRIDERSFHADGYQSPLCARCTGMFLGALAGFIYLFIVARDRADFPPLWVFICMGFFLVLFAVDGGNSYLQLVMGRGLLYEPNNIYRIFTGMGVGISMALLLYPAVNMTMWKKTVEIKLIQSIGEFFSLVIVGIVLCVLVLLEIPWILIPLSFLSAMGVMVLLTLIHSIIWVLVLQKENNFEKPREAAWIFLLSFISMMVQIGAIDYFRFWLTGTWAGFSF